MAKKKRIKKRASEKSEAREGQNRVGKEKARKSRPKEKGKGKKKGNGEGEYEELGGVGDTTQRRVGQRGPSRGGGIQTPGGGGDRGRAARRRRRPPNFTRTRDCFVAGVRKGAGASPSGQGTGVRPLRPQQHLPTPALSWDTRPAGLARPPPPPTDAREPLPHAARTPGVRAPAAPLDPQKRPSRPGGGGPRELGPAEEAHPEFLTFSPGPGAAGADGTSRALPSPPASWSHTPGWGLSREAGPRAGQTRGRGGAGRGEEGRRGGRRRKRQAAAGRTGGIPLAAGGLSRARARVLRYPGSYQKQ